MNEINHEKLMNLCIAGLVSADSNFNNDERKANIKALKKLKRTKDVLTTHQLFLIKKSIKLLKKEIRENFWEERKYKN